MSQKKPKTYVDVNAFIEKARRDYEDSIKGGGSDYKTDVESDDAVEFVEVVRCKLCTQCYHNPLLGTFRCGRFMAVVNPNDFCSYGSKEEQE